MGVHIYENKFATEEAKFFRFQFHLPKMFDKNIEHEIYHILRHKGVLAQQRINNEIDQLLYKYKQGNDIHE